MKLLKKFRVCNCGNIFSYKAKNFIGVQLLKKGSMELYNCPHCGTTVVKK